MMIVRTFTLAIFCLAVISASPTHHKGSSSIRLDANLQANPTQHGEANYNFQDDVARLRQRTQNLQKQIREISEKFVELVKDSITLGVDVPISAFKGIIGTLEAGISSITNMGIFKDVAGSFSKVIDFSPKHSGSGLFGTSFSLPGMKGQGHIGFGGNVNQGSSHNPMAGIDQLFNGLLGTKDQKLPSFNQGAHQGGGLNFDTALHGPTIPNLQPVNPSNQGHNAAGNQHGQQQPTYPQLPNTESVGTALNGAIGQAANFFNPDQKNQGSQVPQNPINPQFPTNTGLSLNGQGAQAGPQSSFDFGATSNLPNLLNQNGPVNTVFPPLTDQLPSSAQQFVQDGADALGGAVMNFENPGGSGTDLSGSVKEGIDALKENIPNINNPNGPGVDASGLIQGGLDALKEKIPDSVNPSGSGLNPSELANTGIDALRENLSSVSDSANINMEGLVPDAQNPAGQSSSLLYPNIQPFPPANEGSAQENAPSGTSDGPSSTPRRSNIPNPFKFFGK